MHLLRAGPCPRCWRLRQTSQKRALSSRGPLPEKWRGEKKPLFPVLGLQEGGTERIDTPFRCQDPEEEENPSFRSQDPRKEGLRHWHALRGQDPRKEGWWWGEDAPILIWITQEEEWGKGTPLSSPCEEPIGMPRLRPWLQRRGDCILG